MTREFQLELGQRKAGAKSVPATLSTEAPVRRKGWDGPYAEVLSHKPSAIDLSRAPLPLLESHDHHRMPIGIVNNLRVASGKLRGDVVFGSSARAAEIAADVEAGIIRNLSVGYSIEETAESDDGEVRTITATRSDAARGFRGRRRRRRGRRIQQELPHGRRHHHRRHDHRRER